MSPYLAFANLGTSRPFRPPSATVVLDTLIPWQRLEELIRPHYPKAGRGRRPYDLSVMLRVHILQVCYNLSDPGMEDLLYEAESVRRFVGLRLREGTIVDATIMEAPTSTKNRREQRDPEMRQVKQGNQYHFGMKLHIGTDSETGLVHSIATTSAKVHHVTQAHRLLHGGERQVWGDAGYIGVQKREENLELAVQWQVALKPRQRQKLEIGSPAAIGEKVKASIRAKVEHPFLYVKRLFGYSKSLPPSPIGGALPGPGQEHGKIGEVGETVKEYLVQKRVGTRTMGTTLGEDGGGHEVSRDTFGLATKTESTATPWTLSGGRSGISAGKRDGSSLGLTAKKGGCLGRVDREAAGFSTTLRPTSLT